MTCQEKIPFPHDPRKDSKARPLLESSTLILTVGHSTHSIEVFAGLLQAHGVKRLVDVRSFPRSRRDPHKLTAWARVEGTKVDYPAVAV